MLDDGHFSGVGVDSGFGGFMDAATQQPLTHHVGDDVVEWSGNLYDAPHFTIPGTDLDRFAYNCYYGDGAYPTWIGRDAGGSVTCFLSDMLIVSGGSPNKPHKRTFERDW